VPKPRVPNDIADWTPPWEEGQIDEEKAKRLLFNALLGEQTARESVALARQEKDDAIEAREDAERKLAAKPQADETVKDQTIADLQKQLDKINKDGRPEDKSRIDRLTVAIDHGLTARDADRLVGKTPEELAEDAAELAERLGIVKDDGEQGTPPPPSNRPKSTSKFRDGSQKPGEAPDVVSAADLIKQARGGSGADGALELATLTH
jgi:hypothetical protein